MSYKNSVKLLISNFKIVWKQLLYLLVVFGILFGIGYAMCLPVINLLNENGVTSEFEKIFTTIYTAPKQIGEAFVLAMRNLGQTISSNFGNIWLSLFGSFIVFNFGFKFFKHVSFYNISSLMHMQMTSFVEIGYTRNLISTFAQSTRYALAKYVYEIPFMIIKAVLFMVYLNLLTTSAGIFFGLFVLVLLLVLLNSLEISLLSGMAGEMLENNGGISAFKSLFKSNAIIFKKFDRVFSNSIIVILTILFVNLFLGIFTVGVALLITLPASMLFKAIYGLTTYFGAKGERYYLTKSMITTPVTDENETINKN